MIGLLLKIAGNGAAFYTAAYFVEGFTFTGNIVMLAWIGFVITLGGLARSILGILTFPISFLSLGIFSALLSLVVSAGVLWALAIFLESVHIAGITALLGATFVVVIAGAIINTALRILFA